MERAAGCQSAGVCNLALELLRDEIPFQPRFLLPQLFFRCSKMDSWIHETEWLALRTMNRCENVIALGFSSSAAVFWMEIWWKQWSRTRVRDTQRFLDTAWNRQLALSTSRGSEVLGSRRNYDGESVQNYDGPWALGVEGALCCSTCERADPFLVSSGHSLSCQGTRGCKVESKTCTWIDCLRFHQVHQRYQRYLRRRENMRSLDCEETELAKQSTLGR